MKVRLVPKYAKISPNASEYVLWPCIQIAWYFTYIMKKGTITDPRQANTRHDKP